MVFAFHYKPSDICKYAKQLWSSLAPVLPEVSILILSDLAESVNVPTIAVKMFARSYSFSQDRRLQFLVFSILLVYSFVVRGSNTKAKHLQVVMVYPQNFASINMSLIEDRLEESLSSSNITNYHVSRKVIRIQSLAQVISSGSRDNWFNKSSNTFLLSFLKSLESKVMDEIFSSYGMQHLTFSEDLCFPVNMRLFMY